MTEECICDKGGLTHDVICVICKNNFTKEMSIFDRQIECKVHHMIMCCGRYEPVCPKCKEEGWYSTAGFGGPTQHINKLTGECRDIRRY
jgi:hypothetical protein